MNLSKLQLMNAAGWIKRDGPGFRNLLRSPVTEINFGSITVQKRPGTTGTNFVTLADHSVNSLGLPNDGIEHYEKSIPALIEATHNAKKKFRLSVAPLGQDDCTYLADFATRMNVDTVELNLGCPNVHFEGKQKPIFAYDASQTEQAIKGVKDVWLGPLSVKLSPYYNVSPDSLVECIGSILGSLLTRNDSIVVCNTLPNQTPLDIQGNSLLKAISPDGQTITSGGMAGRKLMPYALHDVERFRRILPTKITITAAGGIETGTHILQYYNAGAAAFQIGTAYFTYDDPKIFSYVVEDLVSKH